LPQEEQELIRGHATLALDAKNPVAGLEAGPIGQATCGDRQDLERRPTGGGVRSLSHLQPRLVEQRGSGDLRTGRGCADCV
jgi:hypothetical protein